MTDKQCQKDKTVTQEFLEARKRYAVDKYNDLSPEERAGVDRGLDILLAKYEKHHLKPKPSIDYRIDLLLLIGTVLNQG
jgi:hypothetical protein